MNRYDLSPALIIRAEAAEIIARVAHGDLEALRRGREVLARGEALGDALAADYGNLAGEISLIDGDTLRHAVDLFTGTSELAMLLDDAAHGDVDVPAGASEALQTAWEVVRLAANA